MVGKKIISPEREKKDRENCMHAMGIDGNAWNNQDFVKHNTRTFNGCSTLTDTHTHIHSAVQLSVVKSDDTYSKNP